MNTTLKEFGPSVQLWSMFGPLLVACIALAVVVRSASGEWMLPLVALSGTFICYRWGWLGFASVSVVLLASATYQIYISEPAEWLWIIVLTLSIASTLVAALLLLGSSKEGLEVFDAQYAAVQGDVAKLQEQLQASHGILDAERKVYAAQRDILHDKLSKGEEKIASYERLQALVREEISCGHERQEKLLQELSEARQKGCIQEQRIAALEAKAVIEQRTFNESIKKALNEALSLHQSELADLNAQLVIVQEEERLFRRQAESYVLELVSLRDETQDKNVLIAKLQEDQRCKDSLIKDLNERVEILLSEKHCVEVSLANFQKQCEVLGVNEREKSLLANSYAKSIQVLEKTLESKKNEFKNEKQLLHESKKLCKELNERVDVLLNEKHCVEVSLSSLERKCEELLANEREKSLLADSYAKSIQVLEKTLESKLDELKNEKQLLDESKKLCIAQEQQFLRETKDLKLSGFRELCRVEGLYHQLREQFAEKSKVLDQTRRELFYAQEMAAALQKETDEFRKFGNDFVEERLYRMLARLELEMGLLEQSAQREIVALEDIVTALTLQ